MAEACPISRDIVDDRTGRIAAFLTLALMSIFVWMNGFWIVLVLAVDFLLRASALRKWSPIAQASAGLRKLLGIQPVMVNAGPKRFAASIGFLFSIAIFACLILRFRIAGLILAGILVLFAALEAFFGFCVACRIYSLLPDAWRK